MKITQLVTGACFIFTGVCIAAPPTVASGPLQAYPKNLARQHVGSNIFLFNESNQSFVPTEAGAAWLDDDIATGWPAATGHHYYMLSLAEAELVNNFAISTRGTAGTVSLYAADEAALPSASSWVPLAKNISIESINQKKLGESFSRFAKYILIETNLTESGPWYSLYLYGEKPSSAYSLGKRVNPLNAQSLYKYINDSTSISLSSLYTNSRVVSASPSDVSPALQQAIDDNPESSVTLAASGPEAGIIVKFNESHSISRVSALAGAGAKGRLDFYLVGNLSATSATGSEQSQYIKAAYNPQSPAVEPTGPASVAELKPAGSITFDGTNPRGSAEFPAQKASAMLMKWTPETSGQTLALREVNSFGDTGVTRYAVSTPADAVGEYSNGDGKQELDGKQQLDGKQALGGKEALPPVGEFLPPKTPFVPGLPPFPPNIPLSHP